MSEIIGFGMSLSFVCLEQLVYLFALEAFAAPKRSKKSLWMGYVLLLIYNIVVSLLITNTALKLLGILLALVLFGLYNFSATWYTMLFATTFIYMLIYCVDSVVLQSAVMLTNMDTMQLLISPFWGTVLAITSKLICVGAGYGLKRFLGYRFYQTPKSWGSWVATLCLPAFAFGFTVWGFPRPNADSHTEAVFLGTSIGLLLLSILQIFVVEQLDRHRVVQRDNLVLTQQLRLKTENAQNLTEAYTAQRRLSHDFTNHIGVIRALANQGGDKAVCSYIDQIAGELQPYLLVVHTGSDLVDAILNQKFAVAQRQNIIMDFSLSNLTHLPIQESDLSVVLCNLLDNAIEACAFIPENRLIHVRITWQEDELLVCIRNSVAHAVEIADGKISTSKKDDLLHGYGLRNVSAVLQRYHADYAIQCTNQEFIFTAIFYDCFSNEKG